MARDGISSMDYLICVPLGTLMGTLARLYMLRIDYRQYPSYPQGYIIHLSLGFIAAFLGAVALPALLNQDFTAATFLALAATQFREVRDMERKTLLNLEPTELVQRGTAYIEGIARVFEARNYLAIFVALLVSIGYMATASLHEGWRFMVAVGIGLLSAYSLNKLMRGKHIGDIADIKPGIISFDGPLLRVDHIVIMNIGLQESRQRYLTHGQGVIISPKDPNAKATLASPGQMQAIVHDLSAVLGLRLDIGEPEYLPLPRRDAQTGAIGLAMIPSSPSIEAMIEAARRVPVLEASVRKPLDAKAGLMVD
ncbi:MAG: YIEGIA family protein [Limnochordia bacterium]|nr:YIEGIA family protein [Limnochordia bacterium]MDD2629090.1 YIEGIA family protein [Limnochordia bacterium]